MHTDTGAPGMPCADDLHTDPEAVWRALKTRAERRPRQADEHGANRPEFVISLDPDQAGAAGHHSGPIRVLAPAGSGKTRTLTARIAALIDRGIPADEILALAFNTRAAQEMSERLQQLGYDRVQTRTFHSLGYEMVRQALGWKLDLAGYQRLVEEFVRTQLYQQDEDQALDRSRLVLESFQTALRRLRLELLHPSDLTLFNGLENLDAAGPLGQFLHRQWQTRIINFDDMIYFALRELVDDRKLRRSWQARFRFILVDEFQDLNLSQLILVRILALPENNLFVVGDDDQMIYGWRGADVGHILDFDRVYPDAQTVILRTNYRSAQHIVRHARRLIEYNSARVPKDFRWAPQAPPGSIELSVCRDFQSQVDSGLSWIAKIRQQTGCDWGDFAILFRLNEHAVPLSGALADRNMPHTAVEELNESDAEPPQIRPDRIALMTIHKAKGKEFRFVVYFNLVQAAKSDRQRAEERRIAYVAVTRAIERLLITTDRGRVSDFIYEISLDPDLDDFATAYLRRKLSELLARRAWHQGWWHWLRGPWDQTARTQPPGSENANPAESDPLEINRRIERLACEIRFRGELGISEYQRPSSRFRSVSQAA